VLYDGYNKRAVAIVDALGSGHLLGPAFRSRGIPVVHVRNCLARFERQLATFHPADFTAVVEYRGDVDAACRLLRKHGVEHIVSGTESGSDAAEILAVSMGLATANVPGFVAARRDKRVMHRLLAEAGVPIPEQQHLDTDRKVVWQTSGWRTSSEAVVKPPASAGTQGVTICRSREEQDLAAKRLLEETDLFGHANDGVIVQRLLEGPEYMINTVTVDGTHVIVSVWRSLKIVRDGNPVYDRQILEDPYDPSLATVLEYTRTVLNTLGVRWGPSHTEVVVEEEGPLLLETATRPPGGVDPSLELLACGTSLIDETVETYLSPANVTDRGLTRARKQRAFGVSLVAPKGGVLKRDLDPTEPMSLPSFHGLRLPIGAGDRVFPTVDLHTRPGGIYLTHRNEAQLEEDYAAVRAWELREFTDAVESPT
jgi:biotin carboxylase